MDIYEQIVELRRQGRRGAVATITNVRGSIPSFQTAKMLVRDDGSIAGTIGGGCVEAEVWQAAREVMEEEKPRTLTFNLNNNPKYDTGLVCGGTLEIFIEPVLPPALLYVFGAGHVAYNLYKVATIAGFEVVVVDDRQSYANRERFPDAREVIAEDFEAVTARLNPPETSHIVIVTRGHRDDMRILRWAVNTPVRYLGMIGSRRKTISIYKELEKEGIPAEKFANVHAPVGLEIGAVTPEEIAVAIVAEMIAVRRHAVDQRHEQDVYLPAHPSKSGLGGPPYLRSRRARRNRGAGAGVVVGTPIVTRRRDRRPCTGACGAVSREQEDEVVVSLSGCTQCAEGPRSFTSREQSSYRGAHLPKIQPRNGDGRWRPRREPRLSGLAFTVIG